MTENLLLFIINMECMYHKTWVMVCYVNVHLLYYPCKTRNKSRNIWLFEYMYMYMMISIAVTAISILWSRCTFRITLHYIDYSATSIYYPTQVDHKVMQWITTSDTTIIYGGLNTRMCLGFIPSQRSRLTSDVIVYYIWWKLSALTTLLLCYCGNMWPIR